MDTDMSEDKYNDLREDFRLLVNIPFSFDHMDEEEVEKEIQDIDQSLKLIEAEVPGGKLLAQTIALLNDKLNKVINTLEISGENVSIPESKDLSLSVGGVGFSNKTALLPGDTLRLVLALPPLPYSVISTHGAVIRSVEKNDETGSYFDVAVKFQQISEEERQLITRFLFNTQRRTKS